MSPSSEAEQSPVPTPKRAWRFVAWTFGIGWGAAAVLRAVVGPMGGPLDPQFVESADSSITFLGVLFFLLPAIVAFIVAAHERVPVQSRGLRMAPATTLLTAPLVALALALLATGLPVILGISEFEPSGMGEVQRLAEERSVEALELKLDLDEQPRPLGSAVVRGLLVGVIAGLIFAPIVELPWRGLLFTELSGRGFAYAAVVSAALSALWWLPFQLLVGMAGFHGTAAAAVGVGSWALLGGPLAWARVRTGSILPGAILAVSDSAPSDIPRLATAGGSHLQLELCGLAAVGLLAAAALIWPPKTGRGASAGAAS